MAHGMKTGGRQKGTPNKATSARLAELQASGELPLDYMLRVMRDERAEPQRRDDMAKAASPYVHAKLNAITNPAGDGPAELMVRWLESSE